MQIFSLNNRWLVFKQEGHNLIIEMKVIVIAVLLLAPSLILAPCTAGAPSGSCKTCTTSTSNICATCNDGFFGAATGCVGVCLSNCATCTTTSDCSACRTSYFLTAGAPTTCTLQCSDSNFADSTAGSPSMGKCIAPCPAGTFGNTATRTCTTCASTCATCT